MSQISVISREWTELVFAGRNKAYGAYQLRRDTSWRNVVAMASVVVVASLAYGGSCFKSAYDRYQAERLSSMMVTEVSLLDEPKKEAEVKQIIQLEEPERIEHVKTSIKFDVPEIKEDNKVSPEDELRTQDQLLESNHAIGAFDVVGNDDENGEVIRAGQVIAQEEPAREEDNHIHTTVEQMPSFPGGNAELARWLAEHVKYPVVAIENGVEGTVVIGFVVERDGTITDVQVVRSKDPSLDKEAARVVRQMPAWIPGQQNGHPVRVRFHVPVRFRLQ